MRNRKILYGVCGIGNGHTYRQLPIIERLASCNTIVIFAYGSSFRRFRHRFKDNPNVTTIEVAVPYYVGNRRGLDFLATAHYAQLAKENYVAKNARAMHKASRLIGKPDVVISDYEPVCAQYAYAYGSTLITIDQQSKYLAGEFPKELGGQRFADEVMRLRMFFPTASLRLACSFFAVKHSRQGLPVTIIPPVLRPEIVHIKSHRQTDRKTILVYLTGQHGFAQSPLQIARILGRHQAYTFYVFVPKPELGLQAGPRNVTFHAHGSPEFDRILSRCAGLISTAGHSLLAEAMYLGLPVYAMPLPLYEQQMNAAVVANHAFGMSLPKIDVNAVGDFLRQLGRFGDNIAADTRVLLRTNGLSDILQLIG